MTTPSNAELRKAIKQILQPLAASVASKTLGIDGRRAYRLKAERELVALFQAREQHPSTSRGYMMGFKAGQQQLLSELLGELPDKELPEVKPGTLIIEHEGKLVKTENLAKMRNTGFNQAIDQVVSVIERLQNKTNDGGSNGGL